MIDRPRFGGLSEQRDDGRGTRRAIGQIRSAGRGARMAWRGGRRRDAAREPRARSDPPSPRLRTRAPSARWRYFPHYSAVQVRARVADGGGADGVPRACARTRDRRDASRNEGDVNTYRRATLLCATPLTARVRSGRRAGSASRCELARTAPAESVDPHFFVRLRRHTTREHKMCFSSRKRKKDDPHRLTPVAVCVGSLRAAPPPAAARARRSIAHFSPPAARPTAVLPDTTRETCFSAVS